jgi:hypothetical protein
MAIWYNLWPFGTIYGHLVQFMAIWNNIWPFGIFLVCLTNTNLATLVDTWMLNGFRSWAIRVICQQLKSQENELVPLSIIAPYLTPPPRISSGLPDGLFSNPNPK